MKLDYKGGSSTSAWDHIYITSNVHPKGWWSNYERVPDSVQQSFIRRITNIVYMKAPEKTAALTWEDRECTLEELGGGEAEDSSSSITLPTSGTGGPDQGSEELASPAPRAPGGRSSPRRSPRRKVRKKKRKKSKKGRAVARVPVTDSGYGEPPVSVPLETSLPCTDVSSKPTDNETQQ